MSREGMIQAKKWQQGQPKGIYWVYDLLHMIFVCLPLFLIVYSITHILFFFHSIYIYLTLRAEKLKMLCHRFF